MPIISPLLSTFITPFFNRREEAFTLGITGFLASLAPIVSACHAKDSSIVQLALYFYHTPHSCSPRYAQPHGKTMPWRGQSSETSSPLILLGNKLFKFSLKQLIQHKKH